MYLFYVFSPVSVHEGRAQRGPGGAAGLHVPRRGAHPEDGAEHAPQDGGGAPDTRPRPHRAGGRHAGEAM